MSLSSDFIDAVPIAFFVFVSVNICPEDGSVDRTCFDEAQQFVYDLLEKR